MENIEFMTNPIYYCTKIEYEPVGMTGNFNDLEYNYGEEEYNMFFSYYEIKSREKNDSIVPHNEPYFPTDIKLYDDHSSDFLNLKRNGFRYYLEEGPSLNEYFTAYNEMLEMGLSEDEITASGLKKYVSEKDLVKEIPKYL